MVNYEIYTKALKDHLIPATGCTEPIALAYAAAMGRELLGELPVSITACISGSIIKNVKSVVVPGTNGMKGIETAIAAGVTVGKADAKLEVLAQAPEDTDKKICAFIEQCPIDVKLSDSGCVFDIYLSMKGKEHTSEVRIAGHHTNVVLMKKDDTVLMEEKSVSDIPQQDAVEMLKIKEVYEYAVTCDLKEIAETLETQISCNTALSAEGLDRKWGAEIGRTLLEQSPNPDVKLRAMAKAAAGSDARMSGCEKPAVINSGSGNQGITVTIPVVEYAKELGVSHDTLLRALALANLCAIRIKQSIGYLSAYCGAICAGCGAAAGISYLYGADEKLVEHTIVNGLAILSGTICDGAKPSCAAKIAMSVDAGLLGYAMAKRGTEFKGGDGIVKKGIENTIEEVGTLSREGMNHTNEVILDIMMKKIE